MLLLRLGARRFSTLNASHHQLTVEEFLFHSLKPRHVYFAKLFLFIRWKSRCKTFLTSFIPLSSESEMEGRFPAKVIEWNIFSHSWFSMYKRGETSEISFLFYCHEVLLWMKARGCRCWLASKLLRSFFSICYNDSLLTAIRSRVTNGSDESRLGASLCWKDIFNRREIFNLPASEQSTDLIGERYLKIMQNKQRAQAF